MADTVLPGPGSEGNGKRDDSCARVLAFIQTMVENGFIRVHHPGGGDHGCSVMVESDAILSAAGQLFPSLVLKQMAVTLGELAEMVGHAQRELLNSQWPTPEAAQVAAKQQVDRVMKLVTACQAIAMIGKAKT